MEKKCKVMIAEFPGDFVVRPWASEWVRRTFAKCRPTEPISGTVKGDARLEFWRCNHPRISEVVTYSRTDTPIDMVRNHAASICLEYGCDYLLMIDNDMEPDEPNQGSVLFWDAAFPWIFDRKEPAIIFAPYCGGLFEHNNVFVFKWTCANNRCDRPALEQFGREEAADRRGIEKVGAGPTGLMLIDARIFKELPKPWFAYEFAGDGFEGHDGSVCPRCKFASPGERTHKASTEDCYFTRNVSLLYHDRPEAGCFCLWDSWAIHHKLCAIGKPKRIRDDQVGHSFRKALESGLRANQGIINVARDPRMPPARNGNGAAPLSPKAQQYSDAMAELTRREYPELIPADGSDTRI